MEEESLNYCSQTQAAPPPMPYGMASCQMPQCNQQAPEQPKAPNKIREIRIKEVNNGYIVEVGCHTFAIETSASLIAKLSAYISEPQKTEEKWFAGKLF